MIFHDANLSEKNLSTRVGTPAVELVRLEYISCIEVAQAAAGSVEDALLLEICTEAANFFLNA